MPAASTLAPPAASSRSVGKISSVHILHPAAVRGHLCFLLIRAEMCLRPDWRNCSVYEEPDADHICLALLSARLRSPDLSGQSKTSRSFSALELLRGLPPREGEAA
jgi:hypothetical protein